MNDGKITGNDISPSYKMGFNLIKHNPFNCPYNQDFPNSYLFAKSSAPGWKFECL